MRPILFLFILSVAALHSPAQDMPVPGASQEGRTMIFDSLETPEQGKGNVTIRQSEAIRNLVGSRRYGNNVETTDSETFLKIQGFRTQVFSGNNQRASKEEVFQKEMEIKQLFPDVPTYVTYVAPFWKLRAGDFRTHEEAFHLLRQLKQAFPSYGKEMYIVREDIKIPLN
jgi:hypothetical protein